MSLNAWPSVQTCQYRGCVLRVSGGYTKRANSANCLYLDPADILSVVPYVERFYRTHGLPVTYKIIGVDGYTALDKMLESRGYHTIDETCVMDIDLDSARFAYQGAPEPSPESEPGTVVIGESFTEEWLSGFSQCGNLGDNAPIARQMLNSIACDVVVATCAVAGRPVGFGYGALEDGYVGFFDIMIAAEYRGRGFGRMLMDGIIAAAKKRGAKKGYLQVVAANAVARNLYDCIGFTERYRYWYRVNAL
jgi:GNAT superfamily N-acetyltransferase